MWPQTDGLGVQTGYGIQGPNLYLEQLDPDKPWHFPRMRDSGMNLQSVKNSTLRLVRPQISHVELSDSKEQHAQKVLRDMPPELKLRKHRHDEYQNSQYIYDATSGGKILDYGPIRRLQSNLTIDVFAYVTGPGHSQLVVQRRIDTVDIFTLPGGTPDDDSQSENEDDSDSDDEKKLERITTLKSPGLGNGAMLQVGTNIAQVEISRSCSAYSIPKDLIFVRTNASIFIVKVLTRLDTDEIKLEMIMKVDSLDYSANNFSHLSGSPFDRAKFAVIDTRGNWMIFHVSARNEYATIVSRGRMNDAEDMSNFKRIAWGHNEEDIIIVNRNYVRRVNLKSGETTQLVTAKRWSVIRDYQRCDSDDSHGFLLTSRELIWIDVSTGFKRLLSWKHLLNEDDPSLQMYQTTIDDIYFISLYSKLHHTVVLFQFKLEDGLPKSIQDPILLNSESSSIGESYVLSPVDSTFISLFKISDQLELTRTMFATGEFTMVRYSSRTHLSSDGGELLHTDILEKIHQLRPEELKRLHRTLFHVPKFKEVDIDDPELFQQFALSFEIDKSKSIKPTNLANLTKKDLGDFKSFSEFDNMMEQLQEYFESNALAFFSMKSLAKPLYAGYLEEESITSYEGMFNNLLKLWKSSIMARTATKDISLSVSTVCEPEKESRKLNERINKLPKQLITMLDEWDNDFAEQGEEDAFSAAVNERLQRAEVKEEPQVFTVSQVLPSSQIQSDSQTRSQLVRPPSKRPNPASFSQRMSQPRASQLSASQSGQKKKKSRVKGFA